MQESYEPGFPPQLKISITCYVTFSIIYDNFFPKTSPFSQVLLQQQCVEGIKWLKGLYIMGDVVDVARIFVVFPHNFMVHDSNIFT